MCGEMLISFLCYMDENRFLYNFFLQAIMFVTSALNSYQEPKLFKTILWFKIKYIKTPMFLSSVTLLHVRDKDNTFLELLKFVMLEIHLSAHLKT